MKLLLLCLLIATALGDVKKSASKVEHEIEVGSTNEPAAPASQCTEAGIQSALDRSSGSGSEGPQQVLQDAGRTAATMIRASSGSNSQVEALNPKCDEVKGMCETFFTRLKTACADKKLPSNFQQIFEKTMQCKMDASKPGCAEGNSSGAAASEDATMCPQAKVKEFAIDVNGKAIQNEPEKVARLAGILAASKIMKQFKADNLDTKKQKCQVASSACNNYFTAAAAACGTQSLPAMSQSPPPSGGSEGLQIQFAIGQDNTESSAPAPSTGGDSGASSQSTGANTCPEAQVETAYKNWLELNKGQGPVKGVIRKEGASAALEGILTKAGATSAECSKLTEACKYYHTEAKKKCPTSPCDSAKKAELKQMFTDYVTQGGEDQMIRRKANSIFLILKEAYGTRSDPAVSSLDARKEKCSLAEPACKEMVDKFKEACPGKVVQGGDLIEAAISGIPTNLDGDLLHEGMKSEMVSPKDSAEIAVGQTQANGGGTGTQSAGSGAATQGAGGICPNTMMDQIKSDYQRQNEGKDGKELKVRAEGAIAASTAILTKTGLTPDQQRSKCTDQFKAACKYFHTQAKVKCPTGTCTEQQKMQLGKDYIDFVIPVKGQAPDADQTARTIGINAAKVIKATFPTEPLDARKEKCSLAEVACQQYVAAFNTKCSGKYLPPPVDDLSEEASISDITTGRDWDLLFNDVPSYEDEENSPKVSAEVGNEMSGDYTSFRMLAFVAFCSSIATLACVRLFPQKSTATWESQAFLLTEHEI